MTQFLQQIKPNGGEATFPEMWPNTTVPNDFVMDAMAGRNRFEIGFKELTDHTPSGTVVFDTPGAFYFKTPYAVTQQKTLQFSLRSTPMDNMEKTWLKGDQSQPNQSLDQYASTHRVSVKNNLATTQGENSLLNVGIGSVVIVSWGPNSNYLTS